MEQELMHLNYQHTPNEAEADGIAYVFAGPNQMVRYPFKLPELNPNEIRINVSYSGLCQSDALTVNGEWGQIFYPICPGHEITGIVSEIGSDVQNFKVGDRVGYGSQRECCMECSQCKEGLENCCIGEPMQMVTYGDMYWGGYATVIQQPADFAFKLPEGLDEKSAPPLFCAGITTYAPLAKYCKSGDEVAVLGVGGLGHLAVQFAKAMGCKVTAFSSSSEKGDMIKELGAERVISSTDLKALSGEMYKYKMVINTLPTSDEKLLNTYLGIVKPNGYLVQVGLPPAQMKFVVDPIVLISKQIHFTGSYIGSRKEIQEMLEFAAKHKIQPKCEFYEFEDFPKAFDKLVNGKPCFRCVVKCKDYFKK